MSPQDTQSLQNFLTQLIQARGIAKDPQADALIQSAAAQQPDAAYLLVQRALLMQQALDTANSQIAALQSQLQAVPAAPVRGFLDAGSWGNSPSAPARSQAAPMMAPVQAPAAAPAQYQPQMQAPMQQAPMMQAPAASPGFFGGGLGGTLGTVAATAAGVAGGAFLFQGIEHMMHPNSGGGFMNNQSGMASNPAPVENITNNYYAAPEPDNNVNSSDDMASDDNSWDDGSSDV